MFDAPTRVRPQGGAGITVDLPWRDPLDVLGCFADDPDIAFLYSGGAAGPRSRYSYLCVDPLEIVRDTGLDGIAAALPRHARAAPHAPVPFGGGAVGFIGYDCAAALQTPLAAAAFCPGVPGSTFGIYDVLFAWDHAARRFMLLGGADDGRRVERVLARLGDAPVRAGVPDVRWEARVSRPAHLARVEAALAYIRAGDIYQANMTAPFTAARPRGARAADIFIRLASANPAPFSAFLPCGGGAAVASVSPERFIRLGADGVLETRPIKGTRPRGATPDEDARQARALLASGKDRAENLMIADLLRNDLSRVARIGSVAVPALHELESFAAVHHLVSTVTARLRPDCSAIDVLRAALPGGSITGAPKVRAMQIIAELEQAARGPYCGSAAWIGFDGAMDSNILIRTATITPDLLVAQAGGGIVAESDPAEEWDELKVKILPLMRALGTPP